MFFVIYVTFIGVALQFAKTYRIKNNVINILEQYQYSKGTNNEKVYDKLDDYLNGIYPATYNEVAMSECKKYGNDSDDFEVYHGVCIAPMPQGSSNPDYYRVEVYFIADFPFFDIHLTIPASGETKIIN